MGRSDNHIVLERVSRDNWTAFMIQAYQMHKESIHANLELSQKRLWATVSSPSVRAYLIYKGDCPIGTAAGIIWRPFFSEELMVKDVWIFIQPQDRGLTGGKAILSFIRELEAWAAVSGARKVILESSTGVQTVKTEQIYNKLGYSSVGIVTVKEL